MAKFRYYLRKPGAECSTAVYMSIWSQNQRQKFFIGLSIEPQFWNQAKEQATTKLPNAPEFNNVLRTIQAKAEQAANRLKVELGSEPTAEQIRAELEREFAPPPPPPVTNDLLSFFAHAAKNITNRINPSTNKPVTIVTARGYRQTLRLLNDFKTAKRVKVDFDTIDLDFYIDFKTFMERDLHFSANTVGKHIKQLKTVLNDATQAGINTNLKYKSSRFRGISETANNIYLNESELYQLQELDLSDNLRLSRVRDLFLIGCWTGLRFSDFSRITESMISQDVEGNQSLTIETQKTGAIVTIPILPTLQTILDKYKTEKGWDFPTGISNQRLNDYLKELAQMVDTLKVPFNKERTKGGIRVSINKQKWEMVTTHTARRSFSSNMYKRGIPVPFIMAITGHKTETQFYKYIQTTPQEKATKFRQLYNESSPLRVAK